MTSNGCLLRESWNCALEDALSTFKAHLSSPASTWKRLSTSSAKKASGSQNDNPRLRLLSDGKEVAVHRKTTKDGDVYRVTLEIPVSDDIVDLEAWASVLMTPEMRKEWDPAVESAQVVELIDPSTRICKTNFTLGWPANPRDAVTISRTYHDETTLVDVSTSLPRSKDEPSYLRPAPPYVRSHVDLFAWCIQIVISETRPRRIRMTNIWQHDLKTVWNIGMPVSLPQQLATMAQGLLNVIKSSQSRVAALTSYGYGVAVERLGYDARRAALAVEYAIVPESPEAPHDLHSLDALQTWKEQRRLQRGIEVLLPTSDGWDIRISTRASNEALAKLPWITSASKWDRDKIRLQVQHSPLPDDHSVLKVKLTIEFSAAMKGIQLNGLPQMIEDRIEYELRSFSKAPHLLPDASSTAGVSLDSENASVMTDESNVSSTSSIKPLPLLRTESGVSMIPRGPAFDRTILARVRRNYIYFSSLLQEPEAKWKANSDVRGVSVTQLDSIDPTLVVYKAEATFVGVGLWDLYSAIVTPGARAHWDKQYEDSTLLEDVNELTELWHYTTKPAWPVTGRDAVVLRTVYKAPTTIHVFAFSVDDAHLFPNTPTVEAGNIRTQIDLQGWAIDALSPTTTQLTLLEQSDLKGWTGKATIPQQMIAGVAGVGEFAIRHGGPPVLTRLTGARATSQRYDHERGLFRVEYEPSGSRLPSPLTQESRSHSRHNSYDSQAAGIGSGRSRTSTVDCIECEVRCDIDTWAPSLDIVVDPPPQSIIALRRHRLSAEGGGLWLTLTHDISMESDERLHVIVRRAPSMGGKDKGAVMVNGTRIGVDIEELPEAEMKSLAKQKRIKPTRIPLDQPPVMGVIRNRRTDMGEVDETSDTDTQRKSGSSASQASPLSTTPKVPSPLSSFFTAAIDQVTSTTQQAVAALAPPAVPTAPAPFAPGKTPIRFALDALAFVQTYHHGTHRDNWTTIVDKELSISKKTIPEISQAIPVHRADKVIEGVSAEEVASIVMNYDYRKRWDDRFDSVVVLEEYGANCHTSFVVSKTGFPFRDRGMFVASLAAKENKLHHSTSNSILNGQSPNPTSGPVYCVSASFNPESIPQFQATKYNPYNLPIGRLYLDAWVIQTLDPYTSENYAIPSTKCTRLSAVDYAGSVPVAFNSMINTSLPRSLLSLEAAMKSLKPLPDIRFPASSFQLVVNEPAFDSGMSWRLRRGYEGPVLLQTKSDPALKTFTIDVLVRLDIKASETEHSVEGEEQNFGSIRSSRSGVTSRPSSPELTRRSGRSAAASPSPPRRHRKTSSASAMSPPKSQNLRASSREVTVRSSSSAFSIGKDSKGHGPKDFILAELHVDLRAFPDGYEVEVSSMLEARGHYRRNLNTADFSRLKSYTGAEALPISTGVYAVPHSPFYTTGSVEQHVRHLLRLTLPTAQYDQPTVEDPLTGEIRSAPPKPQWLTDLERKTSQATLRVVIRPLSFDHQVQGKKMVMIDGVMATVGNERDASRGGSSKDHGLLLARRPSDADGSALPKELSEPLAIDSSLFNPELEEDTDSQMTPGPRTGALPTEDDVASEFTDRDKTPDARTPADEKEVTLGGDSNRTFFNFLGAYQNLSLLRFGSAKTAPTSVQSTSTKESGVTDTPRPYSNGDRSLDAPRPILSIHAPSASEATASALAVVRAASERRFRLSTLITFMLIAFLLGSLLRSLLSPADFIYVVNDIREAMDELGAVEPGWREIRRLVEVKYIVGGWDFQIAVVRRH